MTRRTAINQQISSADLKRIASKAKIKDPKRVESACLYKKTLWKKQRQVFKTQSDYTLNFKGLYRCFLVRFTWFNICTNGNWRSNTHYERRAQNWNQYIKWNDLNT